MKKEKIQDLAVAETEHPQDGSVLFSCKLVLVDGKHKAVIDIRQPQTKEDTALLAHESALLVAMVAMQLGTTPFACHAGCTFAAIVEEAHKEFHEAEPEEYQRVVTAGLLTKAITTGSQH